MRYAAYLLALIVMQVVAWIITPLLPLFAVVRYGKLDNGNAYGMGARLPEWLSWFDTPDNPISGDPQWFALHPHETYLDMVGWLYRNSLYGFKWGPLACRVDFPGAIVFVGNPRVNRNNGVLGLFRARYGRFWQWKLVKPIAGDFGIMWNFGWQLDEFVVSKAKGVALFQFSPRFVRFK